ncbi:type I restriction enzyme, S subunit [Proteiniborus ethanoligenes]|uniref:Type I restriction enzyme, S subunit n=1 Tax=Proteiniborus ethanoligenes TaxID=415015 RepID=A0A1H3JVP5_9FIRM|nr:restriction endonuclease subunit S [Proteiniborus ethanoligenes]SDY43689.1 type I restriction enzyme, S subunit [Proteiniborus ethanoligenes]
MAKKTIEELLKEALVPVERQPYKVPDNWVWVKLLEGGAECLDKFRKPVNANEREKRRGNVPYYGATGQVGWIDDYLTNEELVLVGEDGAPFYELLKDKAYIIDGKAWVNNHAHILKSYYGHYGNLYLMHYLNQFNYHGYVNGTTRLKLTQGKMKEIPIPLSPLREQQRIVTKIESLFSKVDESRELIEEAREGFENRKAAIFAKAFRGELTDKWRKKHNEVETAEILMKKIQEAIHKNKISQLKNIDDIIDIPYEVPMSWHWIRLGSILRVSSGDGLTSSNMNLDGNIPVYGGNGITGVHDNYNIDTVSIIIGRVGANCGNVHITEEKAWITDNALIVKYPEEYINRSFLYYLLTYLELGQYNSSSAQPVISGIKIYPVLAPLPPLEEQHEIVRILENLLSFESKIEELTRLEEQIELLKKSILTKAFRGELDTNDPTEESAIELLKEVLKEKI